MFALQQLPERFKQGPHTAAFTAYMERKYKNSGWRKARYIEYNPEFELKGSRDRRRFVENVTSGLRYVGASHDIVRLGHTGWFVDNFQDETVHGEVYQLPGRDGKPLYIPAVNDPWNDDCAQLDFHNVTNDKEEAARWADHDAEYYAELEREYQAEEDRKQRMEDLQTEIKDEYRAFRDFCRQLRAECDQIRGVKVVRELVREHWKGVKDRIQELKREYKRVEQYGVEY